MGIDVPRSPWQGELRIEFGRQEHQTIIKSSFQRSPLKIQRPLYPEPGGVCHTIVHHTAGGMVGGDQLRQHFHLPPDCQSFITTPAAAKIYKTTGAIAQQQTQIRIEEGACLELLPQETIVFRGALYHQRTTIDLGANAHYCGWELTRFGRTARGEIFDRGDWKSSLEVRHQGHRIWVDRQWLPGSPQMCGSANGLNNYPIYGNFYWFGSQIEPPTIAASRTLAQDHVTQGSTGVSATIAGMVCRYQGHSTTEAKQWFMAVWALMRQQYLGRAPITPRVWQL